MPRRESLTPADRESLLTVPVIEAEQIRDMPRIARLVSVIVIDRR